MDWVLLSAVSQPTVVSMVVTPMTVNPEDNPVDVNVWLSLSLSTFGRSFFSLAKRFCSLSKSMSGKRKGIIRCFVGLLSSTLEYVSNTALPKTSNVEFM
jgi:hypothetical protein